MNDTDAHGNLRVDTTHGGRCSNELSIKRQPVLSSSSYVCKAYSWYYMSAIQQYKNAPEKQAEKNEAGAGNIKISILVTVSSNIDHTAYLLLGKPS